MAILRRRARWRARTLGATAALSRRATSNCVRSSVGVAPAYPAEIRQGPSEVRVRDRARRVFTQCMARFPRGRAIGDCVMSRGSALVSILFAFFCGIVIGNITASGSSSGSEATAAKEGDSDTGAGAGDAKEDG